MVQPRVGGTGRKGSEVRESLVSTRSCLIGLQRSRSSVAGLIWLCFVLSSLIIAQEPVKVASEKPVAIKILEIGRVSDRTFVRRMEVVWKSYSNYPNTWVYMINYGSSKEIARRERLLTREVALRTSDRSRITILRGGFVSVPRTVIWRVPPGADTPKP